MKQTFIEVLWTSFKKMWGIPATVLGVILSFLMWHFTPDKTITLLFFFIVVYILIIIGLTFFDSSLTTYKLSNNVIPKILLARNSSTKPDAAPLCLLEPSNLFSYDTSVSAYYLDDDGFELLIGTGVVVTVQEDKKIQVLINKIVDGQEDIVNKLRSNDSKIIQKVKIKPSVPKSFNV